MNEFGSAKQVWEKEARKDPLWAVLTDSTKAGGKWDENEFFETGRAEIATVFDYLNEIGVRTAGIKALDFGCGVGRLTQALASHFQEVHGVDISETMIGEAQRRQHSGRSHCQFHVNPEPNLRLFPDATFDFIYSSIVLQHIPARFVRQYLGEFVRILKPGGAIVFQMPERFLSKPATKLSMLKRLRNKVRLRTRLRSLLARLGGGSSSTTRSEMQMNALPENTIRRIIQRAGAQVVDVQLTNSTDPDFNGKLRFLSEPPAAGWISKQYCAAK